MNSALSLDFEKQIGTLNDLAMLSQKMSKEVVLIDMDVGRERNISNLLVSKLEFDQSFYALRFGNEKLKVSQTGLPSIGIVHKDWIDFSKVIAAIIDSYDVSDRQLEDVAMKNVILLKSIEDMIGAYAKTSKLYEKNQSQIKTFVLSGKQEMLSQKMAKEYFMIANSKDIELNKQRLSGSIHSFDKTIDILLYGNARHGIVTAPTEAIKKQLKKVKFDWKILKYKLERQPTYQNIDNIDKLNRALLLDMQKATELIQNHY